MRSAATTHAAFLLTLASALVAPLGRARADGNMSELDQFEERNLGRAIEKAVRAAKSDRAAWIKELESEFPSKVGNPLKEEEYAVWFDLVADKNGEWRRDNSPSAGFKELFDRIIQRLELGPVPNVKRDEFLKYARRALVPGNPPANGESVPDPNEDADRAFRALDRDGDGILELEEMTAKLREDRKRADTDANGRIDKDEYRGYFQKRVTTSVETALAKPAERDNRGGDTKPPRPNRAGNGLPEWFTDLDADKDGQIALSEWRKGKKDIDLFLAMDLNGDGQLTKDEYQRYLKMVESADDMDKPVKGKPEKK